MHPPKRLASQAAEVLPAVLIDQKDPPALVEQFVRCDDSREPAARDRYFTAFPFKIQASNDSSVTAGAAGTASLAGASAAALD